MIQTGDPDSREARVGQALGNGGTGYNIAPEFDSTLFHKRGVIAAARQGDEVNPEKKSSGSQFYIVQGKVYSNKELDELEVQMQEVRKRSFFYQFMNQEANMAWKLKLDSAYQSDNQEVFNEIATELQIVVDSIYSQLPPFKFSAQQRQLYSTIGGTPFLDGEYTVFGEVIEGLDIIDKIAKVKADETNRPVKDIRIKSIRIIN